MAARSIPNVDWPVPDPWPVLSAAEVQVWCGVLDDTGFERARRTLSPEENARAHRFRFERDRRRFVAARGMLRGLLGINLGLDSAAVRLQYGEHGKPFVTSTADVQFNLSHSGELALVAITSGRELGVDLEQVRWMDDLALVAERFLSPLERRKLDGRSKEAWQRGVLEGWTRREAYLKARGVGIGALDDVKAGPDPVAPNVGGARGPSSWVVHQVTPAPGYVGAVVFQGPAVLRCYRWVLGREGHARTTSLPEIAGARP